MQNNNVQEQHVDHQELELFLRDKLTRERSDFVSEHVENCSCCQDELARLSEPSPSVFQILKKTSVLDACLLLPQGHTPSDHASHLNYTEEGEIKVSECGRYSLKQQIAIGGMGEVYSGWDHQLQREVAIKLILNQIQARQLERFHREAKITAHLQHPGVVPVYGLGKIGRRDFIAMKLISGQTLSHFFKFSHPESQPSTRSLKLFNQITQTVAYAHSQGFIHRDLKPDNIMVGEFGEVQVMDWGLSKCIDLQNDEVEGAVRRDKPTSGCNTGTLDGSIMGTPAYMPPEQALGKRADKRADVFALGSILCEILTGRPPFAVESSTVAVDQSANLELEDAVNRLKDCSADPFLIDLAQRCIAPQPAERPADAEEISRAISRFFSEREQKLRDAELEKARVEVRRLAESRRKKQVTMLGVVVVAFLIFSAVSAVLFAAEKARRKSDQLDADRLAYEKRINGEIEIRSLLAEANKIRFEIKASNATDKTSGWNHGLICLEKAEAVFDSGMDLKLLAEVQRFQVQFKSSIRTAQEKVNRRAREKEFVNSLARVFRQSQTPDLKMRIAPSAKIPHALEIIFLDFGIEIGGNLELALKEIQHSNIGDKIIDGLRIWRNQTLGLNIVDEDRLNWVDNLLDIVDSNPWQAKMRFLARYPEVKSIHQIISLPHAQSSIQSVHWAMDCIRQLDDDAVMIRFLESAHKLYPADFEINWQLGAAYMSDAAKFPFSLQHFFACLSIQPDHPGVYLNISTCYQIQGRSQESLEFARRMVDLASEYPQSHINLMAAYDASGQRQMAIRASEIALQKAPDNWLLRKNRSIVFMKQKKFRAAFGEINKAIAFRPDNLDLKMQKCRLLGEMKRFDEAIALGEKTLKHPDVSPEGYFNFSRVYRRMKNLQKALDYAKIYRELAPNNPKAYILLSQILTDAKKYPTALTVIVQAEKMGIKTRDLRFQSALILKKMGKRFEAIQVLKRVVFLDPAFRPARRQLEQLQKTRKATRPRPNTDKNIKR